MQQMAFPVIDPVATGRNILRLRTERGLSVRDLQTYFGFAEPQAIYKWQKGQSLPSVDNLYALSALLGVPMDEILVSAEPKLHLIVYEQQADACCSAFFCFLPGGNGRGRSRSALAALSRFRFRPFPAGRRQRCGMRPIGRLCFHFLEKWRRVKAECASEAASQRKAPERSGLKDAMRVLPGIQDRAGSQDRWGSPESMQKYAALQFVCI